jgi:hypothetical protein
MKNELLQKRSSFTIEKYMHWKNRHFWKDTKLNELITVEYSFYSGYFSVPMNSICYK